MRNKLSSDLTWKGKTLHQLGGKLMEGFVFPIPRSRYTQFSVSGRSGDICIPDYSYESLKYKVKLCFHDCEAANDMEVREWLTGEGDLILSKYPNKRYEGVIEGVEAEYHYGYTAYTVTFSLNPLAYVIPAAPTMVLEASETEWTITNPYNVESYPLIKLVGSGSGALVIEQGGKDIQRLELIGLDAELPLTLDSAPDIMEAYETETGYSRNDCIDGELLTLPKGVCKLRVEMYDGLLSALSVEPRWRIL